MITTSTLPIYCALFATRIIAFIFGGIFLNAQAITLGEVQGIISRPGDPVLLASNLRIQLGRTNISKQEAESIVAAFRNGQPWHHLIPVGLVDGAAAAPSPARPVMVPPRPVAAAARPVLLPKPQRVQKPAVAEAAPPPVRVKPPLAPKPVRKQRRALRIPQLIKEQEVATRLVKKNRYVTEEYQAVQKRSDARLDAPDTGIRGNLNTSNLRSWLQHAGLINKNFFANPSCLVIQQGKGGSSTEQLFFVRYKPTCPKEGPAKLIFIIKEIPEKKAEKEMSNLNVLQKHPELRELGHLRDPSLPQMTFAENFYAYFDARGVRKYIVLLHAARGKSLYDYVTQEGPSDPVTIAAFHKLGEALGNFNKRFLSGQECLLKGGKKIDGCSAIAHGDLHLVNIFYDGKFIYFIDTETMRNSLEKKSPLIEDAVYLYAVPVYFWGLNPASYGKAYDAFLHTYVQTLSANHAVQKTMFDSIRKTIQREASNPRYQRR